MADGTVILGVSFDTQAENKAFHDKFEFGFPLLCDTTRAMGLAYGACTSADAKYADRISYIIGPDGTIEHAEKVKDIDAHVVDAMDRLGRK